MATSEGRTDIRVITPLPSSIVMSLSRLIDQAWPGAELASGNRGEITFRVKHATARELSDEEVANAVVEPDGNEAVIRDLRPGGVSLATPADLAGMLLPILKASFQENPDAANYLETAVTDPADYNRYVMIFARSTQQTPHELRMRAEQKLTTALQDAHRANAAAVTRLLDAGQRVGPDTFQAGVKAALSAMRELNHGSED